MFLVRAWSVPGTLLAAGGLAVLCWNNELGTTAMPTFEFPVRVVRLVVVAAGILLLRPTIDRFREVSVVSPRPLWALDLARYGITAAAFAMVGLVELLGSPRAVSPFTALGWLLALGALAATLAPRYYWVVPLLAGWTWIRTSLDPMADVDLAAPWSLLIVALGAAAYVAANAGLRAVAVRRGRPWGS